MKMKNISCRSKNVILVYRSFSSLLKIAQKRRETIRCMKCLVDSMTNQFFTDKEVGGTWARLPRPKKITEDDQQKFPSASCEQLLLKSFY